MFGLMKNTGCIQADQQDWYRMHYCGTCKSIGSLYGQRSRILLNFDCVFLAELLSVIQETDTKQWDPKLSARSCFSAPDAALWRAYMGIFSQCCGQIKHQP